MFLLACLALSAPVRIWPLGDSITGSPGCWRALLWRKLQDDGYTDIDFVGSQSPQGCGFPFDGEHDGHPAYLITNMAKGVYYDSTTIDDWLAIANPDIAMIHLGTNDCWAGKTTDETIEAFTFVLDKIRGNNPKVYILLCQILPLNPSGGSSCPECPDRVIGLNKRLATWAKEHDSASSPIVLVDQWTGFNPDTDTDDGAHPNSNGNEKMATKFLAPLEAAIDAKGK
jgi:hypothetical protein